VGVALAAVGVILALALGSGARLSALLAPGGDESLLLAVFGLTLLVGGLAEQLQVSSGDRRLPGRPRPLRSGAAPGDDPRRAAAQPVRADLLPLLRLRDLAPVPGGRGGPR